MSSPPDRLIPNYRAPARRAWPAWLTRDKVAELLIGVGWTACGVGAILTAVTWVFLRMEPRQPIQGAWWAFIAFALAFTTLGLAMALSAVPLGFWRDGILRTLWVMTLLLALGVYAAHAWLIATAPAPPKPKAPLNFQAPEDA